MKCAYCGQDDGKKEGKCPHCGANMKESIPNWTRQDPFFYSGYVVWPLRNWSTLETEFQFWQGITLCGSVKLTRDELLEMSCGQPVDIFPDIFEKFIQTMKEPIC
jgi:hypothetical protein